MNGKGDKRRPMNITREDYEIRYNDIFSEVHSRTPERYIRWIGWITPLIPFIIITLMFFVSCNGWEVMGYNID
jgi:hypothetical protein